MAARLALSVDGVTLEDVEAWCAHARRLGADRRDPVTVEDGRLLVRVSVRRSLMRLAKAPGPGDTRRQGTSSGSTPGPGPAARLDDR